MYYKLRMNILIVDDRKNVLHSLKRLILLKFPESKLTLAESGEEAMSLINEGPPFGLIMTDYKMASINGLEVLAHAHGIHADTVRVLLTGYPNDEGIIAAIANDDINYILAKPWTQEQIVEILNQCAKDYQESKQIIAPASAGTDEQMASAEGSAHDSDHLAKASAIVSLIKEVAYHLTQSEIFLMKKHAVPAYSPKFLSLLWRADGISTSMFTKALKVDDKTAMTALVNLLADGLVRIESTPSSSSTSASGNEEGMFIYLTAKGKKIEESIGFMSVMIKKQALRAMEC
ncbi:Hydrogenase transcriptional regulatory protein hupR1 [Piscirickettsia salmonis]|uniref:response regulator n=2 Tax=Piscirickettsia salmonis TaxID=1238 RepID=UPI002046CE2F|nr:response regulator [Piscirickettsia salmonis]QGP55822.1 Hydrogenase transcriptional regulatory protein hupR1 [Piscirickettsia salmonis]QGP58310.1 Hydrogenase transcriptional regulatory protein hupR1 [Piscirickettsia salmonis]QGP65391.1 Hydrogenase transcriptional regulatory protein hupR1 [Piscirickettsia salmonis]